MSLSSSTLAAIQKVGAAAFIADEKLKKEANEYAARVSSAVSKNAYGQGNDALIESWKVVSRLSQTLAGIEEEIQKVFKTASQLASADQVAESMESMLPTNNPSVSKAKKVILASAAKTTTQEKAVKVIPKKVAKKSVAAKSVLAPVDVVVAKAQKTSAKSKAPVVVAASTLKTSSKSGSKPKAKVPAVGGIAKVALKLKKTAAPKAKAAKVKPAVDAGKAVTLGGNPAKLLAYFKRTLNPDGFSEVSQTSSSQATGIPLGSMTAAIKKLTETKKIEVAADGGIKLLATQAAEPVAA